MIRFNVDCIRIVFLHPIIQQFTTTKSSQRWFSPSNSRPRSFRINSIKSPCRSAGETLSASYVLFVSFTPPSKSQICWSFLLTFGPSGTLADHIDIFSSLVEITFTTGSFRCQQIRFSQTHTHPFARSLFFRHRRTARIKVFTSDGK